MPYSKTEAKLLGSGEELTSEPCYKKLKSTAEAYVFPHHGNAQFNRIQGKTGDNQHPPTIIDTRKHNYPQEDKIQTSDLMKPMGDEKPGNRLDVVESVGSQISQIKKSPLITRDDEIYSTSKAFIGPIYKPPKKKKCSEKRNKTATLNGINGKGRQEEEQKFNYKKSEIDTELSQFYKEIQELENEKDDSEGSCKEPEPSQEQLIPCFPGHNNDVLRHEENRDLSNALPSHCGYQQYLGNEPDKYACDGQVMPAFCDISFRPEWQSTPPLIVPHDPPLPSFNYHLNIQRFSTPLNPPPDIFHAQDDSLIPNEYDVHSSHVNWNCLTFDQTNEYTNYSDNSNSVHSRNGYSVQDGYVSNGFYEIREGCWEDPSFDKHSETERFVNQQFQEEKLNKLQKLLILLRGLPGSGKTTLSRILLGQSRDGIVFSTDDYFHHQDGYRYNVNQLGDAHDWNQSRAKQAIDQGRSPVIIDNTNTQAWEMKPYVEMAIGKGYRVEFHEPETWWKFDPEELEKRNKHGVSRKKIAQMLDRYEFQMSISIVMNSVEPTQKSTQRSPPPQGRQSEGVLKATGKRFRKTKQKRNGKRNKKPNSLSKLMDESSFETLGYLTPEDQVPCQNEKADFEDNKRESWYSFTDGSLPSRKEDFVNGYKENSWENIDPEDSFPNVKSIVELDTTPENCFPEEDDNWTLKLPSMPDESSVTCPTGTRNVFYVTRDGHSSMEVEKHIGNRYNLASDIQDLVAEAPCSFMQRREVVDKNLSGEAILCHQLGSRTSDKVLREEQGMYANKNNYWSFFTTNLSDEELQPSSENYSQPYFDSWPEGPHKFVCAQRPKKDRSHKLTCPNSRDQFIKLISTSEGTARPGSSPEILIEEKLLTENNLSGPNETTDLFMETETNTFSSCLPQLDSPMNTVESTKAKKKRQERIFSLAPNFNILAQRYINAKEIEEHGLNIILEDEKNRISEVNNKEDNKQKVVTFDHHSLWFYLEIIRECPLNISKQFYSHYLLFSRLGHAVYFYKNPITSLVLHYISSFWMVSFTNNKTFLTFKSLTRVDNRLTDVGLISSEILSRQPDTLCSLRGISDLNFLNERFNENLKRWEESKPLQCLPVERLQDLKNTDLNFLGLPLPKAFAFQLVKLFGSPGVPMEKTEEDWLKMRIP